MNILFVYPTRLDTSGNPIKYKKALFPPLVFALLDRLTPSHHNVQIINDIVEEIDFSVPYDLVAITSMTLQVERAYQIADAFRERGVKVIMGGMHPTVMPEEAKQHANSVVIGEVDNIWEQILDDCQNNCLKEEYQDTSFPDLQKLVIPKWDNFNMGIYLKRIGAKYPTLSVYTTRGCPLDCKFCSATKFFGKTHRVKPIPHVIQEIESTTAKDFLFCDDNIVINPDYSRELFGALSGRGIHWVSQFSTTILKNPELIDLAGKSGCYCSLVGLESLNVDNLKTINKGFNKVEQYEELIARMRKAGIIPFITWIFGFDEDTPEQFRLTLEFLKKNKVGSATFLILTPLPGTALYDEMKDQGRIDDYNWSKYDLAHILFEPRHFSKQQLYETFWKTYQDVYSVKNIMATIWNNTTTSKNPIREFFLTVFYETYFRKKVYSYDQPVSGGLGVIK